MTMSIQHITLPIGHVLYRDPSLPANTLAVKSKDELPNWTKVVGNIYEPLSQAEVDANERANAEIAEKIRKAKRVKLTVDRAYSEVFSRFQRASKSVQVASSSIVGLVNLAFQRGAYRDVLEYIEAFEATGLRGARAREFDEMKDALIEIVKGAIEIIESEGGQV